MPLTSFCLARWRVSLTLKRAIEPAMKLANAQNQNGASNPKFWARKPPGSGPIPTAKIKVP